MPTFPQSNASEPVGRDLQTTPVRGLATVGGYPGYPVAQSPADDDDALDLREYWWVLLRRRWTILSVAGIAVVAGLIVTFLTTPVYRASVLLQIERESGKVVQYETVMPENSDYGMDFYQTQYALLKSRSLARRVIDQLGLRSSETFVPTIRQSFLGDLASGFSNLFAQPRPANTGDPSELVESVPAGIESAFLAHLTVEPVRNSRLVTVHFDGAVPSEAASIANAIAETFVNTSLERRYEAASYAKKFLEERIELARANLDDSERRLVAYARDREIINLDDKLDILMTRLKALSTRQVEAEAARMAAESTYQGQAKEGSARTSAGLESPVVTQLKARLSELSTQYQEKLKLFKPAYPKMQQIQQQITEVQRNIEEELGTISAASRTTYETKAREEAKIIASINAVKAEILDMQDRSTDYRTLKRDVDTNRQLYDGLLQRMKEVGVVAGIGTNNISVIDPAEVPGVPFKPNLRKNLIIALALGLLGGIGLAFLFETLDDTIKSSEELERRLEAPIFGMVPWVSLMRDQSGKSLGMLAFEDPKSAMAEAYRSLRTALIFATTAGAPRVIHFASPSAGEGKSTTASGTAITFARSGSKVLLIDCDLRNPSQHKVFDVPNVKGLTSYLIGVADPAAVAIATKVPGLFLMPSGPLPPNPVEILSAARMPELIELARGRFDIVILDGPAILGLADALVLANLAGATVLVVESSATRTGALDGAAKRLRLGNANILGAVLVKHRVNASGYGYDYHYTYSYGGNERSRISGGVAR